MAMFFSNQYVQLNGEDIIIPPEVVDKKPQLYTWINNNELYVNGYKYDKKTKKWKKNLYAQWVLIDLHTQFQIITIVCYIIAIFIFLGIYKIVKY